MENSIIIDQTIYDMLQGEEFFLLLNFENSYGNMHSNAQKFVAKEGKTVPLIVEAAMVINNLATRILARFYLSVFRPIYPIQIFSNYADARSYLLEKKKLIEKEESVLMD